jgi:hypothetical protein
MSESMPTNTSQSLQVTQEIHRLKGSCFLMFFLVPISGVFYEVFRPLTNSESDVSMFPVIVIDYAEEIIILVGCFKVAVK